MSTSPAAEPQPARLDRPRPAGLRVLRALLNRPGPATITDLTDALGTHPNTVRQKLELLVRAGFVTEGSGPPQGRGRPARTYALTTAGRQVTLQDERRDHAALLAAVAEQLAGQPDPGSAARDVGRRWGARIADGQHDADLITVMAAQGFTPRLTDRGVELLTCPLLDVARENPTVTCSIHQGLIDALADEPLELLPFALPDACLARPVQHPSPPRRTAGRPDDAAPLRTASG